MRQIDFADFVTECLSLYKPPMRAKGTYRQMSQTLREFAELPQVRGPSDLRSATIAAWIGAHPDRTPVRTASLLRSLSSACRYAVSEDYLDRSPFDFRAVSQWVRGVPLAPERPKPLPYHTADRIAAVLAQADREAAGGAWNAGRMQALVWLLAFTGLRKGEALNLRTWDCDLARQVIVVEPRRTFRPKTRSSAAKLPLAEPVVEILGRWVPRTGCEFVFPGIRSGKPWTGGPPGQTVLDRLRQLGQRAGVEGLTLFSLRKTVGTLAKSWGLGPLEVQALLRHSNPKTQEWYDCERTESLRPAVSRIRYA